MYIPSRIPKEIVLQIERKALDLLKNGQVVTRFSSGDISADLNFVFGDESPLDVLQAVENYFDRADNVYSKGAIHIF